MSPTLTIQTAILNPNNVSPAESGPHKGYFTDPDLLSRWDLGDEYGTI